MGHRMVVSYVVVAMVFTYGHGESDGHKLLNQIIDATLSSKFDEIFTGEENEASTLDMLKYSIQETTIDPDYLTEVFYEAVGATSDADLSLQKFKLDDAVDVMNKVIKHFQRASGDDDKPSLYDEEAEMKDEL